MKPYPGPTRESGVSWIGRVPTHWPVRAIKRNTRVKRGASPRPIDDPVYFDDDGEYAWVRIADVTQANGLLTETSQRLSKLGASLSVKIQPGSLFLSIAGSVGKPCITTIKCCIHDGFVYFPNSSLTSKYLFYIFEAGEAYKGLGKLGTQLNLNTDTVGWIQIPMPSVEEQHAIADFLDCKTEAIDVLIQKKERLIELLQAKRQAIITQAVTKGLNPTVPMKDSGVGWIGLVPQHWPVRAIKRNSRVRRGASPRPIDDPIYFDEEGEYAWVRIADVTLSEGRLETTGQRLSTLGSSLSVKLEPGSLFLSIAGSVGKPCITVIKCCIHDGFVYFPNLTMEPKYLFYIFDGGEAYKGLGKLGTQLNLNTDTVGWIKVPMPPLVEQKAIAKFLDRETSTIEIGIARARRSVDVLREYRQALISAAVTGKVDVTKETAC